MMPPPVPDPATTGHQPQERAAVASGYRPSSLLTTALYVLSSAALFLLLGWLLISPATTCASQTTTHAVPHVLHP